MCNCWCFT